MHRILIRGFVLILCVASVAPALGGESHPERVGFELDTVSSIPDLPYLGNPCTCHREAEPNVAYPIFASAAPLYGMVRVDREIGNPYSGTPYPFAIDESSGTGTGYDRLYVDLDGNGDLSDETPILPLTPLPEGGLFSREWTSPPVWFNYVTFSSTDDEETYSVEALPRLSVLESNTVTLSFMATEKRRGLIDLGQRRYAITLVNNSLLSTRWDRPGIIASLEGRSGLADVPNWSGANQLMAMHKLGGTWWRLSATAQGDRLIVEPYHGPFGTLVLGSGRRFVWSKELEGSLLAEDKLVPITKEGTAGSIEPVSRCQLPVGDYTPNVLNIRYGPLRFSVSATPHIANIDRDRLALTYPLKVRENKTCVLDFSKKADVSFVEPARNARFSPGDEVTVYAFLIDPTLDLMIYDLRHKAPISRYLVAGIVTLAAIPLVLWRLGRKKKRRLVVLQLLCVVGLIALAGGMGTLHEAERMRASNSGLGEYRTLEPKATISRANGGIVAEGVMPFG